MPQPAVCGLRAAATFRLLETNSPCFQLSAVEVGGGHFGGWQHWLLPATQQPFCITLSTQPCSASLSVPGSSTHVSCWVGRQPFCHCVHLCASVPGLMLAAPAGLAGWPRLVCTLHGPNWSAVGWTAGHLATIAGMDVVCEQRVRFCLAMFCCVFVLQQPLCCVRCHVVPLCVVRIGVKGWLTRT